MDSYRTLSGVGEAELVEKKSKFFGYASPVISREEALGFIASVRKKHKDASHNVPAYSIKAGNLTHAGDDGEPSGTAGIPVLDVLQKAGIVDAAIVVTRYFGGTLLGTGGLVRAYSATAAAAVRSAGIAVMTHCAVYSISVDYPLFEPLQKLLESGGARVDDVVFTNNVTLCYTVKKCEIMPMLLAVRELTRGGSEPQLLREIFDTFEKIEEL